MQIKSKKMLGIKRFFENSAKTIDRDDVFGYTDSKEAIP